jgi:pimeloyl-ACP methyl ester carboxylesterase
MRSAQVREDGSMIRWVEIPGAEPARIYLHGLGASSAPYYAAAVSRPELAGRRSLLMDLLGFGVSDRPADAAYTLEDHADWVALAMETAGVEHAEVVAHSMGGAVAIVLAARHPHLVANLVLLDANLDPAPPIPTPGSSGIARYLEEDFLAFGWEKTLERIGPSWAATMRLAGREALYRSAVHLAVGSEPLMRELLQEMTIPRTFLHPAEDGELKGSAELTANGVHVVAVPDSGHNIMLDNPDFFVRQVAAAFDTGGTTSTAAPAATSSPGTR